eukprot:m.100073 g.100073  ORF g.100073 m.100073 type:complete len:249 (-) comp10335_c0_seq1:1525-2271(-)
MSNASAAAPATPPHTASSPSTGQCGAWVTVTRTDGGVVEGVLHTIDPETGAAFVVVPVTSPSHTPLDNDATESRAAGSASMETSTLAHAGQHVRLCVISGHAIVSIEPLKDGTDPDEGTRLDRAVSEYLEIQARGSASHGDGQGRRAHREDATVVSPERVAEQKAWVLDRLQAHRIPCVDKGNVVEVLGGVVHIKPPYDTSAISSRNAVVLRRVQLLLDSHTATASHAQGDANNRTSPLAQDAPTLPS